MEEQIGKPEAEGSAVVADIQFRPGQKVYYFDPAGLTLAAGDRVIIETARGEEYGVCTAGNHAVARARVVEPLRSVIRMATEEDLRTVEENRAKETQAMEVCREKIALLGLDMQLVSAEYAFDGSKLLFFFTADERVDFRELVRQLAYTFHTRIELRQIGVRDKARLVGGLGICGRSFCCSTFLDSFQSVSIRMAKTQNLSLNPVKISGTCGRLLCCLQYEQESYEEMLRTAPKEESLVDTPDGRGTIERVAMLAQKVWVRMERDRDTVNVYAIGDIAVLRSGRARSGDPPIPDDLAPISGAQARAKREEEEREAFLTPIRFRFRGEAVVDEGGAQPDAALPESAEKRPRKQTRRGGKRARKAEAAKAKSAEPAAQKEKPAPKGKNARRTVKRGDTGS